MNSRLLSYFLAVYENQGFSAAAAQINISQPALTKSIQQLEIDLGVQLFERLPKGVVATRYADILARRLRLMDIEYRHALAEIDAARGGSEGVIRIGAGPAWYSCLLPPIIRDFLEREPDTQFRIETGIISSLIPKLESGEVDIVCTSLDFPNRAHLIKEPTIELRHAVIAAQGHPLAGHPLAEPAALAGFPWVAIANDHVGTGRIWSYFAGFGCTPPKIAVETESLTSLYECVAGGRFLAHVPEVLLPNAARHGIVPLSLKGVFWETPTGMIYRQTQHRLPVINKFIDAIRAQFAARP